MTDPLGLIGSMSPLQRPGGIGAAGERGSRAGQEPGERGPDFKQMLQQQIDSVNKLQTDATAAVEDLATGRRDDVETVIMATQKADTAFRMLLQVRNKVMDAYEEVKQVRI